MYDLMLFDFRKPCRAKLIVEGAAAMKNNV